ncbi:uncharacterized protein EI97DRAFT_131692 [Westerdykella ornata]|uniref:Uncharacterized protein n=1 Tax=Westerdykella ornata TaxID=318751 RepID=A0A6A6JF19_WESOR|nr:uncharacterized protein EI97DRAFT_131692 [Westerdykella ornata]KAF2274226.1 hypothetical protein EI97DRAFT_131692 [Westerdykella ornata]
MCIIVPVDHISCTHTVAIWQHCVNAPKSRTRGLSPCLHIRQHPRPIVTRQLCINCGGPRVFARRGGLADRGWGKSALWEQAEEHNDSAIKGSRYLHDAIEDEEGDGDSEDLDLEVSPRQPCLRRTQSEEAGTRMPYWRIKSVQSQDIRATWQPNLKRELISEAFSGYQLDDPFAMSKSSSSYPAINATHDGGLPCNEESSHTANIAQKPQLRPLDTTSCRPFLQRKGSTLLHPSTPTDMTPAVVDSDTGYLSLSGRPPNSMALPFHRRCSTFTHPSTPSPVPSRRVSNFPVPMPENPAQHELMPQRKESTLLHPSTPSWSMCEDQIELSQPKGCRSALPTPPSSSHSLDKEDIVATLGDDHKTKLHGITRRRKNAGIPDELFTYCHLDSDSESAGSEESDGEFAAIKCCATRARMARASRAEFKGADGWRCAP